MATTANDISDPVQPSIVTDEPVSDVRGHEITSTDEIHNASDPPRKVTNLENHDPTSGLPASIVASGYTGEHTAAQGHTTAAAEPQQRLSEQSGGETQPHCPFDSYSFLQTDFLSKLSTADSEYLQRLGCFQLPVPDILDDLVAAYFRYVQPHLPLIDEGSFWSLYASSTSPYGSAPRMSLALLYAMILVSCAVSQGPSKFNFNSLRYQDLC